MEYPYLEIYECLELAGVEECPKQVDGSTIIYTMPFTLNDRLEVYQTDGNVLLIYAPNMERYMPFWPHACWDHVFYILASWNANGALLKKKGMEDCCVSTEMFGSTMLAYVRDIMESFELQTFQLDKVWKLTVEAKNTLNRMIKEALEKRQTVINPYTRRS